MLKCFGNDILQLQLVVGTNLSSSTLKLGDTTGALLVLVREISTVVVSVADPCLRNTPVGVGLTLEVSLWAGEGVTSCLDLIGPIAAVVVSIAKPLRPDAAPLGLEIRFRINFRLESESRCTWSVPQANCLGPHSQFWFSSV